MTKHSRTELAALAQMGLIPKPGKERHMRRLMFKRTERR